MSPLGEPFAECPHRSSTSVSGSAALFESDSEECTNHSRRSGRVESGDYTLTHEMIELDYMIDRDTI